MQSRYRYNRVPPPRRTFNYFKVVMVLLISSLFIILTSIYIVLSNNRKIETIQIQIKETVARWFEIKNEILTSGELNNEKINEVLCEDYGKTRNQLKNLLNKFTVYSKEDIQNLIFKELRYNEAIIEFYIKESLKINDITIVIPEKREYKLVLTEATNNKWCITDLGDEVDTLVKEINKISTQITVNTPYPYSLNDIKDSTSNKKPSIEHNMFPDTDKTFDNNITKISNFYSDQRLIQAIQVQQSSDPTLTQDIIRAIEIVSPNKSFSTKESIVLNSFLSGLIHNCYRNPKELVPIQGAYRVEYVVPIVYRKFKELEYLIKKKGYKPFLFSGYRSSDTQKSLFMDAINKYRSPKIAAGHVAPYGTSRHQFGTDIDLRILGQNGRDIPQIEYNRIIEQVGFVRPYYWEGWHITLPQFIGNDIIEYNKNHPEYNSDSALWRN